MHFGLASSRILLQLNLVTPYLEVQLIRTEALISLWMIKGVALIRGRRLFEALSLLKEIRYITERNFQTDCEF